MSSTNARIVAIFSLAVGVGLGYLLQRRNDDAAASQAPAQNESTPGNVSSATEPGTPEKGIRLVVQRFRKASLLVEDSRTVTLGGDGSVSSFVGILVYTSFAKSATKESVMQAAKTIMNLPLLTRGVWGDGSDPVSVLDMAGGGAGVMLVPQANLISKVKSQGKSIQYHSQIDKETGKALYQHLVDCVKAIALEHQCTSRGEPIPKWLTELGKPDKVDASVPPSRLFLDSSMYSSWDDKGIPQCDQHGEPLTKSALKKLKKMYLAQEKRHDKYLRTAATDRSVTVTDFSSLDDDYISVVAGTFGGRQGLDLSSDMGPFCHVLNL